MPKSNSELELKYLVSRHLADKAVKRRFRKRLRKYGFVVKKRNKQNFSDVYYDSQASDFQAAGWSIRLRFNKADTLTITVKSTVDAKATFRRTEHEEKLPRNNINLSRTLILPANSRTAQFVLCLGLPDTGLEAVYRHVNKRKNYIISHPSEMHTTVQWSIDKVTPDDGKNNKSRNRYVEYELELLTGAESLLQHLKLIADRCTGLSSSRLSKLARGRYAHAPHTLPRELTPARAQFATSQLSHAPFNLMERVDTLIGCEPFAYEASNPEGVHQFRITTRKLRASLDLLDDQAPLELITQLQQQLKNLTKVLGKVRDLDVHHEQVEDFLRKDGWHDYRTYLSTKANKKTEHMRYILDQSFPAAVAELDKLHTYVTTSDTTRIAATVTTDAADIIEQVASRVQDISPASDAKQLHQLRKDLKKFHYQLVTFAPGDELAGQWLVHIKHLLSVLGDHQDTQMAQEKIYKYLRGKSASEKRALRKFSKGQKRLAKKYRQSLAAACQQMTFDEVTQG